MRRLKLFILKNMITTRQQKTHLHL